MKPRTLAIDWGGKRVGIALSDPFGSFAIPQKVIQRHKVFAKACTQLMDEIAPYMPVGGIVVGLPLELSGKEGAACVEVRLIGAFLAEKLGLPIHYIDERMTSKIATRFLMETGMKRRERSKVEDSSAAALILQTFLDQQK